MKTEEAQFFDTNQSELEKVFGNKHCFCSWIGRHYKENNLDLNKIIEQRKQHLEKITPKKLKAKK